MGAILSNKKHYSRNLLSNYTATIISALLGFISAPISLNYWRTEQFGIWAIITSLAAYLSISGLGIDAAAGILMTKNNSSKIKRTIFRKSIFIVIISAVLFLVLFIIVIYVFPDWYRVIGNMSDEILETVKMATTIFIIFFIVNLPFGVISNSFAAYQKAYLNNIFIILNSLLFFIILLIVVYVKGSLINYSLMYGCTILSVNIIKTFVYFIVLKTYNIKDIKDQLSSEDCKYNVILKTGFNLWFYGLAVLASTNISNLIISNTLNVSSVTPFILNYKLYYMAFLFITAINLSSAPLFGKEYGQKNWYWIKNAYHNFFIITVVLGGAICLGGLLFLRDILYLWVGSEGYAGFGLIVILGLYFFFNSISNINYIIINSLNYTSKIGFISWAETGLFILFSIVFVKYVGVYGVALGMLIGSVGITQWALPLIIYRRSEKRLKYNLKIVLLIFFFLLVSIPVAITIQNIIALWYFRVLLGIILFFLYIIYVKNILSKTNKFTLKMSVSKYINNEQSNIK